MVFDNAQHKDTIISLINEISIKGKDLEYWLELKKAILSAEIVEPKVVAQDEGK